MVPRLHAKPPCTLHASDQHETAENVLAGYMLWLHNSRKESSETLAESWPRRRYVLGQGFVLISLVPHGLAY